MPLVLRFARVAVLCVAGIGVSLSGSWVARAQSSAPEREPADQVVLTGRVIVPRGQIGRAHV